MFAVSPGAAAAEVKVVGSLASNSPRRSRVVRARRRRTDENSRGRAAVASSRQGKGRRRRGCRRRERRRRRMQLARRRRSRSIRRDAVPPTSPRISGDRVSAVLPIMLLQPLCTFRAPTLASSSCSSSVRQRVAAAHESAIQARHPGKHRPRRRVRGGGFSRLTCRWAGDGGEGRDGTSRVHSRASIVSRRLSAARHVYTTIVRAVVVARNSSGVVGAEENMPRSLAL